MSITKLNKPLTIGGNEAYPLTTADQIIKADGSKLETSDGISVDNAEKLGGKSADYFASAESGIHTYVHTTGKLTGTGINGKFKATVNETVSTLTVNGTACSVQCGEDAEMELIAGCWYTFILDGTTVNFKQGGAGLNFKIISSTTEPASPKENTIWINNATKIHNYDFDILEPSLKSKNKNLIAYPYYNKSAETKNGVTFTAASTGYITVNGTNSHTSHITHFIKGSKYSEAIKLTKGTYTLSGCPTGGSTSAYRLECAYSYNEGANWTWKNDTGSGVTFTLTEDAWVQVKIRIETGITLNNAVFKPQLEKSSSATSFLKGDATGQVWVRTTSYSQIKLKMVKNKPIYVPLQDVWLYNGSEWIWQEAKIYQNSEWKDLYFLEYENSWHFVRTATINSQPKPADFVGKTIVAEGYYADSSTSISMNMADSYSGKATTWLYFDKDITLSISYTTDDAGTVTINDTHIGNLASCAATTLSSPFKKGWNKLEICYTEGSGGDGWVTSPKLSTHTDVRKMYAKINNTL